MSRQTLDRHTCVCGQEMAATARLSHQRGCQAWTADRRHLVNEINRLRERVTEARQEAQDARRVGCVDCEPAQRRAIEARAETTALRALLAEIAEDVYGPAHATVLRMDDAKGIRQRWRRAVAGLDIRDAS